MLVVCLVFSGCVTRLSPFEVTVVTADGTPLEGAFVDVEQHRKDPFPKYRERVLAVTDSEGRAEFLFTRGGVHMLVVREGYWPLRKSSVRPGDRIVLPESSEVWEALQSRRLSSGEYWGVMDTGFAYAQAQRGELVFREDDFYDAYVECLEHLRREGIFDAHDVERRIHSVPLHIPVSP